MPLLENPQHEAFAQVRFTGKTLVEAHYAAGYAGDKAGASRLNQLFEVKERIAEFYREAAAQTAYEKTHAVRDLLTVIHACASEASDDHPLCEVRMGKDGPNHRFPPKLQAMARLIKLMGWDEPVKVQVAPKDNFIKLLEKIRDSPGPQHSNVARHSDGESTGAIAEDPSDPESVTDDDDCSTIAPPSPATAQPPLSARQESFANARVKGLGVMAAYRAAGYTGDSPNLAWRLNSMPAVKSRIAELNGGVETATGYRKDDAVRDLLAIIHAHPSQAGPDHPLCEMRLSAWGPYHRFPSKLAAIALLIKMLGWQGPMKIEVEHDPDARFKQLAEFVRTRS